MRGPCPHCKVKGDFTYRYGEREATWTFTALEFVLCKRHDPGTLIQRVEAHFGGHTPTDIHEAIKDLKS